MDPYNEFIKNGSFWTWKLKQKDSPFLKRLLEIRDFMLSSLNIVEITNLWNKWFRDKGAAEAYEWFRPKGVKKLWPTFVWKSFIPPKYSFITWQAAKERLYSRDRLTHLNINLECPHRASTSSSCAPVLMKFGRKSRDGRVSGATSPPYPVRLNGSKRKEDPRSSMTKQGESLLPPRSASFGVPVMPTSLTKFRLMLSLSFSISRRLCTLAYSHSSPTKL